MERLRFDEAARGLQEFFWGEFCDWYLEIAKYELTKDKRQVQTTLAYVLETSLRLLHPFLPYITEEIWQHLPHEGDFIMSAPYPTPLSPPAAEAEADMARLMGLITAIRRMRSERKMPPKDWAKVEIITEDNSLISWLKQEAELLAALTRSKIEVVKAATLPGPSDRVGAADLETAKAHTAGGELSISGEIYISREVDEAGLKSELARLRKALEGTRLELARTDKNLANEDFVSRAPAEVIEKTRARREQAQGEIASLQEAIVRLEKQIG
jgi:valyl-tRNA synthetase